MNKPEVIATRRHPVVQELRAVRDERDSPLMFLEGPHLVCEALHFHHPIEILAWTAAAEDDDTFRLALPKAKRKFRLTESVFEAISDVESPQGVVAVARRPEWHWRDLSSHAPAPLVILNGLQDPGNVASIVRTAEAAGAAGIVTTPGTAHLFSPKGLRGAMGSTLRIPSMEHRSTSEIAAEIRKISYRLAGSAMKSSIENSSAYTEINWQEPWAIVLGQEGKGLSKDWNPLIDQWIHIPMQPPVESLNVASAAAILLYESYRHRQKVSKIQSDSSLSR